MIWSFILDKLKTDINVILLIVLESQDSSPGRQGFKMVVSDDGELYGSIGGGIMEHKLVVKSRDMLEKKKVTSFFIKQIHRKDSPNNQSGMICSGEQTIALIPIQPDTANNLTCLKIVESINQNETIQLSVTPTHFSFKQTPTQAFQFHFKFENANQWEYRENLLFQPQLFIIGGGHVGLALSRQMALLGFHITILDDRSGLNTMDENKTAHEKKVIAYEEISDYIPERDNTYVVIMSFGYRSDKVVLKKLLKRKFKYIGMMGSQVKIDQLLNELAAEGISEKEYSHVFTPIGLSIASKTPAEIAVSIAGEIIKVKNQERQEN